VVADVLDGIAALDGLSERERARFAALLDELAR
jgi:hypothetical protein